ncbi:hypothetical protein ACI76Y_01475 [Capnocytophaga cynodegmi]|uniref:hypothetical protein n=1 Tax=Capnocytophaga cynodegmi TaxID=28189 RepID=UPI003859628C
MKFIFDYILFFVKSIHLHGVHSPFVFSLINNCLRSENKIQIEEICNFTEIGISERKLQLLLQFIEYFDVKYVFVDDEKLKKILQLSKENIFVETEKLSDSVTEKYDLIFINKNTKNLNIISFLEKMHNDSVLIINDIHKKKNKNYWENLVKHSKTTACINTFTQGYIFIRKEQKKEVFYIKL